MSERPPGDRSTVEPPERESLPQAGNRHDRVSLDRTRLDGVFLVFERAVARIDGWIHRWVPAEENPLAQTGRAANLALAVAVATGVLMLIWYAPSVHQAHSKMAAISGRTLGGWVRALHRYSSDLTMLLLAVHAARMLLARKFTGSRRLAWVSGVVLLAIVWGIGWTGFWLVWDQPAQQVAVNSMLFLDSFPIFGEPMGRLFVADRLVPSLLFFVVFFLHMLLPLLIAAGLVVHLARLSRVALFPGRRLGVSLLLGLALAAWLVPAPLDDPARMDVKAEAFTVDAWYLTPLALTLRFGQAGLWIGLAATAAFAAVPWLFGRAVRRVPSDRDSAPVTVWQTSVLQARCHACTQCVQDCPFDAVRMAPRSDGKLFDSRAWVDPDRCTGCGVCVGSCDSEAMSLGWFDTQAEESRMLARMKEAGSDFVALVAGDIDGGRDRFRAQEWRERLTGYAVEYVPTSSWVRPKFLERLFQAGVRGVLIVRDGRVETMARSGNRWVAERLAGERTPKLKPERAGSGRWRVMDYVPGGDVELGRVAAAFKADGVSGENTTVARGRRAWLAGTALTLLVIGAALGPSHLRVSNPEPPTPEFVFSFKAFGEMPPSAALDPAEEAKKPVHMRGRVTEKPRRQPVVVRMQIDGEVKERAFEAKGIGADGPAIDQWRVAVKPGSHVVRVEVSRGRSNEPLTWTGTVNALNRRRHVLTYEPDDGFRLEPVTPP